MQIEGMDKSFTEISITYDRESLAKPSSYTSRLEPPAWQTSQPARDPNQQRQFPSRYPTQPRPPRSQPHRHSPSPATTTAVGLVTGPSVAPTTSRHDPEQISSFHTPPPRQGNAESPQILTLSSGHSATSGPAHSPLHDSQAQLALANSLLLGILPAPPLLQPCDNPTHISDYNLESPDGLDNVDIEIEQRAGSWSELAASQLSPLPPPPFSTNTGWDLDSHAALGSGP
jgi:hypothetical protein